MNGGYVSIKDELLYAPSPSVIKGAFEYAKSLISANKPIFGIRLCFDDNDIGYPCAYTGCVVKTSPTNIRIIIQTTSFDSSDYTPDIYSTVFNIGSDDTVT